MTLVNRTIQRMLCLVLGAVAVCTLLSLPAWAGPSGYRTSLTSQYLANGFERSSVVVLKPDPGPGRQVVTRRLLSKLNGELGSSLVGRRLVATDFKQREDDGRTLSYLSANSSLEVYGDGSKFRFRGDIDHANAMKRTLINKLANADIESLGRTFITKDLGDFVKLRRDESIAFLGTRYLRNGGTDLKNTIKDEVVANIAIFGREVFGVPVVGSGSKIAVWFTNDGKPVGFDVDWPTYRPTRQNQQILSREKLESRVKATTITPASSSEAKFSRFECGYVDLGVTKRGNTIQAGCAVSYEGRSGPADAAGNAFKWARIEFVPAGVKVLEDRGWPLTQLIAKEGEPTNR